jgi:hypothetical protein
MCPKPLRIKGDTDYCKALSRMFQASRKGSIVFNPIEVDFMLIYLRRELEHVDRAIVALERKARTQRGVAVQTTKYPVASERGPAGRAGRGWHHRSLSAG